MSRRPHILYVVNADWFFLSHRLPIARAARAAGARVTVAAGDTGKGDVIRQEGFDFVPLPIRRKSTNPITELHTIAFLLRLYRQLKPDLVHHVTIKPVIYGSLVARLAGPMAVVNAISGLGFVFSEDKRAGLLRPFIEALYRTALHPPNSRTIFQNPDDLTRFLRHKLVPPHQAVLIRGSGVDCRVYKPTPEPPGAPLVMLASRMLWAKGVREFVDAARVVRRLYPHVRFVLVGAPDDGNPSAVPANQLRAWHEEGVVEWWGHRTDMPAVLSQASVVVLPTFYPEGVPKVLIEAAASGRPIVATNVPGCREIVRHQQNGLLVPPHDPVALADAIRHLIESKELRERFGQAGREIAVNEFAVEIVVEKTLALYRELLGERWPSKESMVESA